VAIGECGLDFYYDHSDRDVQRTAFAQQIALAKQLDLTLVIHTRNAWPDTFDVLDSEGMPERVVFHCFTGDEAEARQAVQRGAWLSFSGIVTFNKADDIRRAAKFCPADKLLTETDAQWPHSRRTCAWLVNVWRTRAARVWPLLRRTPWLTLIGRSRVSLASVRQRVSHCSRPSPRNPRWALHASCCASGDLLYPR